MSSTNLGPVVVGVDGSPGAAAALQWAVDEARSRACALRVVSAYANDYDGGVFAMYGRLPLPEKRHVIAASKRILDAALDEVRQLDPELSVDGEILDDAPHTALIAESKNAALLVVGSRGLQVFGAAVLGSVALAVVARAHCPVIVVRGPAGSIAENASVVVGVDAAGTAPKVLDYAFDFASRHGVRLRAVLCWRRDVLSDMAWRPSPPPPPEAERWLAEALAGWREQYPDVEVVSEVIRDQPAVGLVQAAAAQYLLVVGSRGRNALSATLLGSVSHGVLHHATCPVAVVPVGDRG